MRPNLPAAARAAASVLACVLLLAPHAHADERHERHEFGRERYGNPHWVYDDRFHHNRYYPAAGYAVTVLPPGNIGITFRGGRLFFHAGVWYQPSGPGYVVVRPPVGVVVPVLPPGYATVWVGRRPVYYANDVYYAEAPGGYAVTEPPAETGVPPAPPGPSSAPSAQAAPGTWYYCDAAKAYYPYVQACPAGWRAVPAALPPR